MRYVVAYGNEIHVYDNAEAAEVLYTTVIGANLDAVIWPTTATRLEEVVPALGEGITVIEHYESD